MSIMLGQFDPQFTEYMNEVMTLYRQIFKTDNQWTLLVDGTVAGIETVLTSVIEPGGLCWYRSSGALAICCVRSRTAAKQRLSSRNQVYGLDPQQIEDAIKRVNPKLVAVVQGDTSTTMAQPLNEIGPLCQRHGVMGCSDTSFDHRSRPSDREWQIDAVSAGLQKCLSGPPESRRSPSAIAWRDDQQRNTSNKVFGQTITKLPTGLSFNPTTSTSVC